MTDDGKGEDGTSRLYQRRKGARGMLPFVDAATPHLNMTREIIHVDGRTGSNWTAMHFASMQGHLECVKTLLQHGAQVNIVDENGMTALHFAAYYGHATVVQALLRAGAEVDAQTSGVFGFVLGSCPLCAQTMSLTATFSRTMKLITQSLLSVFTVSTLAFNAAACGKAQGKYDV